jgi:predicted RNase H-like nuclease (RuvC/YqgF family)
MGNFKYLLSGVKVFINRVLDQGFLVQDVFETGDDGVYEIGEEIVADPIYYVEQVYDHAPTQKLDDCVKGFEKRIVELRKELFDLDENVLNAKKAEENRLKKYEQFKALKHLDNFIDGKIQFLVVINYSHVDILPIKDFYGSNYNDRGLKLVTLFGNSIGKLEWGINQYKDGSGSYTTIVPCLCYQEALECVQKQIDEWAGKENRVSEAIETTKKYKLKISNSVVVNEYSRMIEINKNEIDEKNKYISNIDKEIAELQCEINKLNAETSGQNEV